MTPSEQIQLFTGIVSAIGLVLTAVGLFFVIISLRQTRRSINAATYQHILDREAANWERVRSGDIPTRVKALQHFGISVSDKNYSPEMDVLCDDIGLFNFYEGIFFLRRQKALDQEVWQNWNRALLQVMTNSTIRKNWGRVKHVYNPLFVGYVERLAPLS